MAGRDTTKLKFPVVFILQLIFLMFSAASAIKPTPTTVKLHEAATLYCYKSCSGLVTWFHKQNDDLASCNQTSCQSQEGFQMLHDEYLKGNLSLIITDADFTKRKWYTCQCDDKDICDVSLYLEPFNHSVDVQAGDSLTLDLLISDDVEVTFQRTDDPKTSKLCTVVGRKAECESSYEKRVSVSLKLKDVKNSDGGVYTIRDIINDEVIGTYTVTINERRAETDDCKTGARIWQDRHIAVAAVCGGVVGIILVIIILIVKPQLLQKYPVFFMPVQEN